MTKRTVCAAGVAAILAAAPGAQETPEALEEHIAELRTTEVPWREIPWHSCLLEGLASARRQDKPVVLWMFIDRPFDDRRC